MPPKKAAAKAKGAAAAKAATGTKRGAAAAKGRGGKRGKKAADEEEEEDEEPVSAARQMINALQKVNNKKTVAKVDTHCFLSRSGATVHEDYDCMLNQTNIGHNNNKFYVIQVIQHAGNYYAWNRWGRVGEPGQNASKGPFRSAEPAIKDFEKKFKDKTKNDWENRDKFVPVAGKYTLIEMGDEDEEETPKVSNVVKAADGTNKPCRPSALDKPTQDFISLIFNTDMFNHALQDLELDTKKMPLGKISKVQIAKGFEVLEKLEATLNGNKQHGSLADLSSTFYTLIPHNFGRQRPPSIADKEALQKKMDMLTVLSDIELAQAMQKTPTKATATADLEPNPLDIKYEQLKCGLKLLSKTSPLFKTLETYLNATGDGGWRKLTILDIWEVDRQNEGSRFKPHDGVTNRKLLWHGTNVAVVAAILQSGLRIMPHSGGRVGKGIYFASENSKSAGYVRLTADNIGIMFLNEVALGKEHHIVQDDGSLRAAPKGFDSIVAKGWTEPDPTKDTTIMIDGKKITVPQGKPLKQTQFQNSSFSQSEYLIYREDQCRIRFVLKLKFT